MIKDNCKYKEKNELGRKVVPIVDEGTVFEETLSKKNKEAFHLYRKQKPRMDTTNIELRSWQKDFMDKMTNENKNKYMLWIHGHDGNEGKSWMQSYIEVFYGHATVIRLEIPNTTSNILYTLFKHPLQSTDIFEKKKETKNI